MDVRYKLFKFGGRTYLFDGNNIELVELANEDSVYEYIPKVYSKINSHRADYLKTICLVLNNSCNLNCQYCFANKGKYDKPNEQMKFEKAKEALDNLIRCVRNNNGNELTVAFFGGEPLLSFELIKRVVEYMKNKADELICKYMITTNGTLITPEIANFFEVNKFNVTISIDGNEAQHNIFRKYISGKGSYSTVMNAVNMFKNKAPINARITIASHNTDIFKAVESIVNLGIKRITFALDYKISESDYITFESSFKQLIEKYITDIKSGKYYDITNITSVLASIVLHQRCKAHCNAGISYITLSADAKYYRCPRFVGNEPFCMGTVEESHTLLNNMQKFKASLGESAIKRNLNCENCPYVYLCGGVCYHHAYVAGFHEHQDIPMECVQNKLIFDKTIELICRLSTFERSQLLLFLIDIWNNYGKEKML